MVNHICESLKISSALKNMTIRSLKYKFSAWAVFLLPFPFVLFYREEIRWIRILEWITSTRFSNPIVHLHCIPRTMLSRNDRQRSMRRNIFYLKQLLRNQNFRRASASCKYYVSVFISMHLRNHILRTAIIDSSTTYIAYISVLFVHINKIAYLYIHTSSHTFVCQEW